MANPSADPATLAEYDAIEQGIALGYVCAVDGKPCEFQTVRYKYGEDLDGNRGEWREYERCRKCGEEPAEDVSHDEAAVAAAGQECGA